MSFEEFAEIYVNASDDARILIAETLENLQIQSACPAEDFRKFDKVQ